MKENLEANSIWPTNDFFRIGKLCTFKNFGPPKAIFFSKYIYEMYTFGRQKKRWESFFRLIRVTNAIVFT